MSMDTIFRCLNNRTSSEILRQQLPNGKMNDSLAKLIRLSARVCVRTANAQGRVDVNAHFACLMIEFRGSSILKIIAQAIINELLSEENEASAD